MKDLVQGRKETIVLPDVLNGAKTAAEWLCRRNEILELFETAMFGKIPPRPAEIEFETVREVRGVFGGLGIRRDIVIHMRNNGIEHTAKALWYLPEGENLPLVLGLNFQGNAGCTEETDVELEPGEKHGSQSHRWQIPYLLQSGFSLITAPRNHFFPDHEDGRKGSIFRLFHPESGLTREARDLTAISAWAWAYSRLLELGETDPRIDRRRIWAHGHSRLGKTSLWCAANDPRFAGTVSNDSGCCGAALCRDKIPGNERFSDIARLPWWFTKAFDAYSDREDELPFDLHWLCALAAPRPLLIASATEDIWADPFNEYRSAKAIAGVYRLFGAQGLADDAHFPAPEEPLFGDRVGYYLRSGIHGVTATDWKFVLEFIRRNS